MTINELIKHKYIYLNQLTNTKVHGYYSTHVCNNKAIAKECTLTGRSITHNNVAKPI